MSSSNSDHADSAVMTIINKYGCDQRNMLPLLHELQAEVGYLSPEIMEAVAERLGTTVGQVHGVATFYSLFSTEPKGRYVVRLCDSPPCHIEGSKAVLEAVKAELGISEGETTEDGMFTLETVSCLGLCGVGPAMMVNDDVYGNLKPEMIPHILAGYREEN
ncbi:MAG: NADH-quinone oxidoreductase subunit NuoE [Armatimonadetes bacterium]|nr:NADH-quinone oxidoreductase subunit NuoE [Armatimonadota bacterium]